MKSSKLTLKKNSIVLFDGSELVAFDWEGRWFYTFLNGRGFRRGLNGKVIAKKGFYIREFKHRERENFEEKLFKWAEKRLKSGITVLKEIPELNIDKAKKVLLKGPDFWKEDSLKFEKVYRNVGILPPDRYLSFVIQVTEGCHYNRCTFCDFYKDKPFRLKNPEEIKHHIEKALDYFGEGISLRRDIFLSDANALLLPLQNLKSVFKVIKSLPLLCRMKIHSFMDVWTGKQRSQEFYNLLKENEVETVYVGMETGSRELLEFLNKPQKPEDSVNLVQNLKRHRLKVGVIVMIGIGGDLFNKKHIEETRRVIGKMTLDRRDILYFSDFVAFSGLPYIQKAKEMNIRPLSEKELKRQREALSSIFTGENKPIIARYSIKEFIY